MTGIASSNSLGMALLNALGLDTKLVLKVTLTCSAGEPALLTVTRSIPSGHECLFAAEIAKYSLSLDETITVGSSFLTPHVRTTLDPVDSRESPK